MPDGKGGVMPVKHEVGVVLRFDKVTGEIEPWDLELDVPSPTKDMGCFPNNCGGGCCIWNTASEARDSGTEDSEGKAGLRTDDSQSEVNPGTEDPPRKPATVCVICICCNGSAGCTIDLNKCS